MSKFYLVLFLGLINLSACQEKTDPLEHYFKDKKVLFLGNSITQAGIYVSCISYFLDKSYPNLNTEIISIGLSSETVSCLTENDHPFPRPCLSERLDRALAEIKPDVVVACYGMNDGIYHPLNPANEKAFQQGILQLKEKVEATLASLILMTPPPFDPLPIQSRLVPKDAPDFGYSKPYEKYDTVLETYAKWIKTLASDKVAVVDLHSNMNEALKMKRQSNMYFRFAEDGIHPGFNGHILMAKIFLQELGILCKDCENKSWVQLDKDVDLLRVDKQRKMKSDSWLSYIGYVRGDTVKTHSPKPLMILMGGQSNMVGQGKLSEISEAKLPPNIQYVNVGFNGSGKQNQENFGPELSLSKELAKDFPHQPIILLKYAIGGSSLLDWAPDYSAENAEITGNARFGNMYQSFFQYIDSIRELYDPELTALLWMQGERDARIPEAGKDYYPNFKNFIESCRERIGEPDLPIIFAKVNPPKDRYPALETVNEAQQRIADEMEGVFMVETAGIEKHTDNLHYNTEGQLELGSRFAEKLLELIRK